MGKSIQKAVEELWGCGRSTKRPAHRAGPDVAKSRSSRVLFDGWAVVRRIDGRIVDFCPVGSRPQGREFVRRFADAGVKGWSPRRVVVRVR